MQQTILNNGIKTLVKNNKNTPRIAFVMYSKLNKDEPKAGLYYLMSQLLFQGTTNRSSEQLAMDLEENAIDISVEKKADYLRFKVQCLKEDIELAMSIFQDIIENSTFAEYEKEIIKIKGEFAADLDSAKVLAQDNYYRTIFKNHSYGIGRQEVLDVISSITKDDLFEAWNEIKSISQKNIVVVGDVNVEKIVDLLNMHLSSLSVKDVEDVRKEIIPLVENVVSVVEKEDANQAQIFQGWQFPNIYSEDYPLIILLNTILGSSGLSSRLFLELREKQGLAYTVRSVWEPFLLGGNFFVYIGTEPKNIKTSIEGFKIEINKIMTELVGEEELNSAKMNAIGKRQFYQETNMLEAILKGYYEFLGLGYDYEEKLIERINNVTSEELINVAKKYFSVPTALSVLAPKKYLSEANLI